MTRDIAAEGAAIDAAVAGRTICQLFSDAVAKYGDQEAAKWKVAEEEWTSRTWAEYGQAVTDFGKGMVELGLGAGEFVNLLGGNRFEYSVSDFGVLHAGGIPVSLYNTLAPEQIEYIVNHCEASYVICENRDYLERILKVQKDLPNVRKVIMWEGADEFADNDWIVSYDDVVESGRQATDDALTARTEAVKDEDLVTLIYTSGTTGPPKGVMVTHRNVYWTLESIMRAYSFTESERQISYLPMAHIAERMIGHYSPLYIGSTVHYCPDPRQIAAYLTEVRPTWFFAVPRIWEKLFAGLQNALKTYPDEDLRNAANQAVSARLAMVQLQTKGEPIPDDVQAAADEAAGTTALVASLVGLDQVTNAGTGAAPIALEILEFFSALGVPLYEVYGQSEDTGPTSWNRPDMCRLGTVGPTIPGVEVKLADDGELLVRGGNVTQGYYKEPELTAETFQDGWLLSGDIAEIDDGYIRIVDRKKEILITAGGKNIAPSNVENLMKGHPAVGGACMIADQKPYAVALIALDPDDAAVWAQANDKPTDVATLSQDADLRADIEAHITAMNEGLHNQEQIKKFTILANVWTPDSGEVTPTLKMKRKVVNERYAKEIEELYA